MRNKSGIAVIESTWWRGSNVSVRGMFELIADIGYDNPHDYHYEMANSAAALKEAIPRIALDRKCKYLCLAMHGDEAGIVTLNDNRLSRSALKKLLVDIKSTSGAKLRGIYLSCCLVGTAALADYLFREDVGVSWIAGYSTEADWIESSALDFLFFNTLVRTRDEATDIQKIHSVAARLRKAAPGLIEDLGFGIYVRKQATGGAKNLLGSQAGEQV